MSETNESACHLLIFSYPSFSSSCNPPLIALAPPDDVESVRRALINNIIQIVFYSDGMVSSLFSLILCFVYLPWSLQEKRRGESVRKGTEKTIMALMIIENKWTVCS